MANDRNPTPAERTKAARRSLVERIAAYVERVRAHRRIWAPPGGGRREVDRRRMQLEAGTLRTNHQHFQKA